MGENLIGAGARRLRRFATEAGETSGVPTVNRLWETKRRHRRSSIASRCSAVLVLLASFLLAFTLHLQAATNAFIPKTGGAKTTAGGAKTNLNAEKKAGTSTNVVTL